MSLSFPNPALTNALTKVPARLPLAESTLAVDDPDAKGLDTGDGQERGQTYAKSPSEIYIHLPSSLGLGRQVPSRTV